MSDQPTLQTMLNGLYQVGMQAVTIMAREREGSTYDVAERVMQECECLSDSVRDEIAALKRHGVQP